MFIVHCFYLLVVILLSFLEKIRLIILQITYPPYKAMFVNYFYVTQS